MSEREILLIVFLISCACATVAASNNMRTYDSSSLLVNTAHGPVLGRISQQTDDGSVLEWLSIPYGTAKRFENPVPPASWTEPLKCQKFPEPGVQWNMFSPSLDMIGTEFPFYLNVYASRDYTNGTGQQKPVIFIIHGGGQNINSAGDDYGGLVLGSTYYPSFAADMARKGAVVVTPYFRLSGFGAAYYPQYNITGGYYHEDQILALKWVKANIAKWGGDPDKVTIYGVSGGATAVTILYSSPKAEGLFHRAWAASSTQHMSGPEVMANDYLNGLQNLNCTAFGFGNDIGACLRGVPQSEVFKALTLPIATTIQAGGVIGFPFGRATPSAPVGNPELLPAMPAKVAATTGLNKDVPLVATTVHIELSSIMYLGPVRGFCAGFAYNYALRQAGKQAVDQSIINWVENGLDLYADTPEEWTRCMSDIIYITGTWDIVRSIALRNDRRRAYYGVFEYNVMPGKKPYAEHGDDIQFVAGRPEFGLFDFAKQITPTPDMYVLSGIMQDMLLHFAETGSLANFGWPEYRTDAKEHLVFGQTGLFVQKDYCKASCEYWTTSDVLLATTGTKKRQDRVQTEPIPVTFPHPTF